MEEGYNVKGRNKTAFYKISTFITKLVSGGDPRNYATGSCTCTFTWAPREFPEKLRYAVDLRTTIKHGIINTALTRFANVTPSSAGGNAMALERCVPGP